MYDKSYYEYEGERKNLWEADFYRKKILRPDQKAAIDYVFMEDPGLVASIGCGMCLAEERIAKKAQILCFDSSDYPCSQIEQVQQKTLKEAADCKADTWLFLESLEHIPYEEIVHFLAVAKGRVIIVNDLELWPIGTNGKDHITRCDDYLYDVITHGRKVRLRYRSHLIFYL